MASFSRAYFDECESGDCESDTSEVEDIVEELSGDESSDSDNNEESQVSDAGSSDCFTSRSGLLKWSRHSPSHAHRIGNASNLLNRESHAAPYVQPSSLPEAFGYFFSDSMIEEIIIHTNEEAQRVMDAGDCGEYVLSSWK